MKDSDWILAPDGFHLPPIGRSFDGGHAQDIRDFRKSLTLLEMTRRVIEPDYPLLAENIKTHLSQFKPKDK